MNIHFYFFEQESEIFPEIYIYNTIQYIYRINIKNKFILNINTEWYS